MRNISHEFYQLLLLLHCLNSLLLVEGYLFPSYDIFGHGQQDELDNLEAALASEPRDTPKDIGYAIEGDDDSGSNSNDDLSTEAGSLRERLLELGIIRHDEIYILEDKDYPKSLFEHYPGVGQVSGITVLPSGDVAIVHRADREWNNKTFSPNYSVKNVAQAQDNLIKNDTIMIIDREHGGAVTTFGSNLFYLPHSVASDNLGNLWVSDVGRHQVMRLPTSMMQLDHTDTNGQQTKRWLPGNLTRIWPDIILGEAFVPGKDRAHFCQPSEVVVTSDGSLVFVADGYCNQRVMVFSGRTGNFIGSFGEEHDMNVVHSITLIEQRNLLCAADRENGRILCFKAGLDGDLATLGELMLTINYPLGRVFAIEALSENHMLVSSNQPGTSRFDLAALNPFTSELKQTWTSSDLLAPHSLARTMDGLFVYAADMSRDAYRKVFKFNIIRRRM